MYLYHLFHRKHSWMKFFQLPIWTLLLLLLSPENSRWEVLLAFSEGRCVDFIWNAQIVSACLFLWGYEAWSSILVFFLLSFKKTASGRQFCDLRTDLVVLEVLDEIKLNGILKNNGSTICSLLEVSFSHSLIVCICFIVSTLGRRRNFNWNAALFLRSGLPYTRIRHENGAFQKRSFNRRKLETPAFRFRVDGNGEKKLNAIIVTRWRHEGGGIFHSF